MMRFVQIICRFLANAGGAVKKAVAGWLVVAVAITSGFEGLRQQAYLDPVGIPTICFGETLGVKMGQTKSLPECQALLAERLQHFDRALAKCFPGLVNQHSYTRAALVSWTYNVGEGAACKSTLVRRANAGRMLEACNELPKWDKATKLGIRFRLPGLTKRRHEERDLCLAGVAL